VPGGGCRRFHDQSDPRRQLPAHLDSSLRPLQPVLRDNFWLVVHVLTITLSYAAFALALGIADIALGYYLVRSKNREVLASLSTFIYKRCRWACFCWHRHDNRRHLGRQRLGPLLGLGSEGSLALITLLCYLALLHARYTGWLGEFGLAAWAAICFFDGDRGLVRGQLRARHRTAQLRVRRWRPGLRGGGRGTAIPLRRCGCAATQG